MARVISGIVGMALGGFLVYLALAGGGCLDGRKPVPISEKDKKDPKVASEWGEFLASPKIELLGDGRDIRLLDDFSYVDPRKKAWVAPKETIANGASIPRAFWTIVGGPLEGQYRNASIIHDAYCEKKREPWEDVHLMFYEACRCGGVGEQQAKVLYAAVYHFGPRWKIRTVMETRNEIGLNGVTRKIPVRTTFAESAEPTKEVDAAIREKLEKLVSQTNPSLEDLKKLNPNEL